MNGPAGGEREDLVVGPSDQGEYPLYRRSTERKNKPAGSPTQQPQQLSQVGPGGG